MYISGVEPTVETIRAIGNESYCKQEEAATGGLFLSSAIGSCGSKEVDLTNAYATLGRMGVYKPSTSVIEVKNSQGDVLKKWKDESKEVLDPQIAYILNDILADQTASAALHGYGATSVPGVKTSVKTGTSDKDQKPKDLWIASYSPALTMTIRLGNSDTSNIRSSTSSLAMPVVRGVMQYAHQEIYAKDGRWNSNMWYTKPSGIQQVGSELYPSWWNKNQGKSNAKLTFDKVSKNKATDCTPSNARIELEVTKSTDPVTKSEVYIAPDGYDASKNDDVHSCGDAQPVIDLIDVKKTGGSHTVKFNVSPGKFKLTSVDIVVGGKTIKSGESVSANGGTVTAQVSGSGLSGVQTVTVNLSDEGMYSVSRSATFDAD